MTDLKWTMADRLLVIRLDALGDVLMTSPAWRALKESSPGRRLTLLTSKAGAEVARYIPEIDEVMVYEAPWMKATPQRSNSQYDLQFVEQLRERQLDGAIIFNVYSQNPLPAAFLCYMADIPLRLAYCHENPYHLLTHWVVDPEPQQGWRHEVQRQLDLVATIGCGTEHRQLSFAIPPDSRRHAAEKVHALGLDLKKRWLVIHPGASASSRRYPPEHFARVVAGLWQERQTQVLFTGAVPEQALIESIAQQSGVRCFSLAGALDLSELAAVIAMAPLLISNNTGPAHIASAVGTPLIDLYALTNPQHTPWAVPHRVLYEDVPCKYCYKSICPEGHHQCLRGVSPDRVLHAVDELFPMEASLCTP